eukprot:1146310-Pelagomonas_calceolata.AAC.4
MTKNVTQQNVSFDAELCRHNYHGPIHPTAAWQLIGRFRVILTSSLVHAKLADVSDLTPFPTVVPYKEWNINCSVICPDLQIRRPTELARMIKAWKVRNSTGRELSPGNRPNISKSCSQGACTQA